MLINRPRAWEARPGRPEAYEICLGKIVFAGTYLQTYTRLTTMEAAPSMSCRPYGALNRLSRGGRQGPLLARDRYGTETSDQSCEVAALTGFWTTSVVPLTSIARPPLPPLGLAEVPTSVQSVPPSEGNCTAHS
jgi:hypothetical protein